VIHANDWHTGFVSTWLATAGKADPFYAPIATLYTIHNVVYHGTTGDTILRFAGLEGRVRHLEVEPPGAVNWMARGIAHSDVINTVSKRYAQEILTPEFGAGMESLLKNRHAERRLCGILNGVDYDQWNPAATRTWSNSSSFSGRMNPLSNVLRWPQHPNGSTTIT
jgi:starch synthase